VIDVGRDERCIERECMSRNSGIEVLNPRATAFESCFDAAERLADGIALLGSGEFCGDQVEPRLQGRPALRPRQTLDAKRDLCKHGLRYGDVGRCGCRQSLDDCRGAFHQRRDGVGV
jgi:hypothetical protein